MNWIYLLVAITGEVVATTMLKSSNGFTKPIPSLVTVVGYGVAFYCLSLALKTIPIGVAYAVWSGVGIVFISMIGYFHFKQSLDPAGVVGVLLILSGVVVLNVFSKMVAH